MLLSIYVHITMLIIISIIGFFFFYRFEHYMPPPHNTINRAWHFSFFITHRGYLTMLKYFACYQFNLPMFCCRNFIVHNFFVYVCLKFRLAKFSKKFVYIVLVSLNNPVLWPLLRVPSPSYLFCDLFVAPPVLCFDRLAPMARAKRYIQQIQPSSKSLVVKRHHYQSPESSVWNVFYLNQYRNRQSLGCTLQYIGTNICGSYRYKPKEPKAGKDLFIIHHHNHTHDRKSFLFIILFYSVKYFSFLLFWHLVTNWLLDIISVFMISLIGHCRS